MAEQIRMHEIFHQAKYAREVLCMGNTIPSCKSQLGIRRLYCFI